ncbi:DUF3352 domain-containing protein [Leptolyngbya sp. CCNP1308]|uniref:DUF3352 domain-containing protein n=1 Tax=Leptolyngbya sp. CCNP1308 TaxID=3110255 RepID=UPI002B200D20|nr:DUF3352 domain-containing protein [Leptolyngbya sp. CCNP1308]MEA5449859.1 DUF3352 domain-containing protein [Leptolyngbya sp. CCNP1308]
MGTGNRGWGWNQWVQWTSLYPLGRRLVLGLMGSGLAVGTIPPLATHAAEADIWHHLPNNTALVLLIDTTADTWGQLSQYQLFKLLDEEQGLTPALPGLPYLPYGIDFASEVAPWIGDTAVVALLPVLPGETTTIAEASIMVAPVTDAETFNAFRDTFFELQGDTPEITTALGTEIYFWPAPEFEDWSEPAIPEACGPAEANADDCTWDEEADPEIIDESSFEAEDAEIAPLKARPTQTQILRFNGAVGLPLTVKPFHEEGEDLEVEVPVPLPEFGPSGLAVAFLPDALITAENPAAIEQYLRLRQDRAAPSLIDSQEFQRTLANRQRTQALFAVYGNALELLNYDLPTTDLPAAELPLPFPLPSASLDDETLQSLRSLNFGGTLEALVYPLETGMQVRGRYYYDAVPFTFGLTPTVANADSPLELLPASTFVVTSGRNIAGFWRTVARILDQASDFTRDGLATVRAGFTLFTGLDLDDDVFGWMDGEYAIAAFPVEGGPLQYVGLGLLLQTSDRPTADRTLAAVDDLLPSVGLAVNPRTVNQQPATSWELFSSFNGDFVPDLSVGSHGWVTDDTLAITSGAVPMASVLAPSPHDPLADFFLFDQATATFPNPNDGYFYVNVGATLALAYEVFGFHDDPSFDVAKPYLGSLRSLSATTALTPNHMELQSQLGLAPRRD